MIQKVLVIFFLLMFNGTGVYKHILGSNKNVVGKTKSLCPFPIPVVSPISGRPPLLAWGWEQSPNEIVSHVCNLEKIC